jgi:hypothetical protein
MSRLIKRFAAIRARSTLLGAFCVGGFALLGAVYLMPTQAATYSLPSELETGQLAGSAQIAADATASAGHAVAFGTGVSVPAAIDGTCTTDVAAPIEAWLQSLPDHSTANFGAGKCYRLEQTIELSDTRHLTIAGNGATFKSLNPPTDGRAFWRFNDMTGLKLRHMSLIGSFTYTGSIDHAMQHAHAVDLRGSAADISHVTATNIGGDCVYYGLGSGTTPARSSGTYQDSSCTRISRNAVSVVAGDDITVSRVTTDDIGYITFDVEPNVGAGNGSDNVIFDDNTIGHFGLVAYSIVENELITDQVFKNNRSTERPLKITIGPGLRTVRPSRITLSGNTSAASQPGPAINADFVDNLSITNNALPVNSGYMAVVYGSCRVTVSGNTAGNGSEYVNAEPATGCTP